MKLLSYVLFTIFVINAIPAHASAKRYVQVFGKYVEYRSDNLYVINGERVFANGPRQIEVLPETIAAIPKLAPVTQPDGDPEEAEGNDEGED